MRVRITLIAAMATLPSGCGTGTGTPQPSGPAPYGLSERPQETSCEVVTVDGSGTVTAKPLLSDTGCYSDMATKAVAAGMLPFDLTSALWSDDEIKNRYFWIPAEATIGYTPEGTWELPVGTMLMKEFILRLGDSDADGTRYLETRFIIRGDAGWTFHNYRWEPDGSEATLLSGDLTEYVDVVRGGQTTQARHDYPSPLQCLRCHPSGAGTARGLQTPLMNRTITYAEAADNQLRTLEHIGLFTDPLPGEFEDLPRMPPPEETTASAQDRARSFMHSNCAHCHQPEGSAVTTHLDLRYHADLVEGGVCDLLLPGDAEGSTLWQRMALLDMPPIATFIEAPHANLVKSWIDGMKDCP